MKRFFYFGILIFLISCADKNAARIQFLYDNVSHFKENVDFNIYVNDSLVLADTLPPHNVADDWFSKIVTLKKGKYSVRVISKMQQLTSSEEIVLSKDTNIIIEFEHNYVLDSLKRDSFVEGKKILGIMPVSFRH